MKKIISVLLVLSMAISLFACKKPVESAKADGNAPAVETVAPVQSEYTKVTVNENGVKIYGKIVDENTASEVGKSIIKSHNLSDKKQADKGYTYTYSEYESPSYGGKVIIRTGNKEGSKEIYNEDGDRFLTCDDDKYDLENTLAKYRLGNAMAEAIDRKVKGN